jgi:Protein of unknown function (DUF4065)
MAYGFALGSPRNMPLDFDVKKAIGATAYLIEREGGTAGMFVLLKSLYYADRSALINWGKPITGDSFASLDKGPIVAGIYDLLKGKGSEKELAEWNDVITRDENSISTRKRADTTVLSEREIEILEHARSMIRGIQGPIADWLHKNCPEWEDPHGSSIPIDPSQILRQAGKSEEEIRSTEEANEEIRLLNHILRPR